jgi:hypothetical protein
MQRNNEAQETFYSYSDYEKYWAQKNKKYAKRRAILIFIGIIIATFLSSLLTLILISKI